MGTNFFNYVEKAERFKAAKELKLDFVRLAPNKWLNGRKVENRGDYFLGRPGKFKGLIKEDLPLLLDVLNKANQEGLKVILTMLSLPGNRWRQHNGGVQERMIWKDFKFQDQAISFWSQLAAALKGHPALVGYNIKNEPSPEHVKPRYSDWFTSDYGKWYEKIKGTPADLNLFYRKVVQAIRKVDSHTSIILDSGFYGTPWAFKILEPVDDDNVLYSFHMYEPYLFTNHKNKGQYLYPGSIPTGEKGKSSPKVPWDKEFMAHFLRPVRKWQEKHKIPSTKILVGEFGLFRKNKGAVQYIKDLVSVLKEYGWHRAFYSFREEEWDGMDYELGTGPTPPGYWTEVEKGNPFPGKKFYKPNPLFQAIIQR